MNMILHAALFRDRDRYWIPSEYGQTTLRRYLPVAHKPKSEATADTVLRAMRDMDCPVTSQDIVDRIDDELLTRQMVNYHLNRFVKLGKVEQLAMDVKPGKQGGRKAIYWGLK